MKFIQSRNGQIQQGDQGALNAILSKDTYCFSPRFNSVTIFYDFTYEENSSNTATLRNFTQKEQVQKAIEQSPIIIHFHNQLFE